MRVLIQEQLQQQKSQESSSPFSQPVPVVGLVPCAVGATYLEEWSPNFRHRNNKGLPKCDSGSTYTSNLVPPLPLRLTIPDNANYQPRSNRGCHNLFSCSLRSFYIALLQATRSFPEISGDATDSSEVEAIKALVGGVVWSQGCNDSIDVPESQRGVLKFLGKSAADSYEDRQAAFLRDMRWGLEGVVLLVHQQLQQRRRRRNPLFSPLAPKACTLPPPEHHWPPIVTVAVTATRPWMVHLSDIRRYQLSAATRVPNLLTVDSLGSFLKTDCVHLTTSAAMSLGQLLAGAMVHLMRPPHPTESPENTSDIQKAQPPSLVLSVSAMVPPSDSNLYAQFSTARSRCEEVLNDYYTRMTKEERRKNKKKYPIFDTGLKPVNFVRALMSYTYPTLYSLFSCGCGYCRCTVRFTSRVSWLS